MKKILIPLIAIICMFSPSSFAQEASTVAQEVVEESSMIAPYQPGKLPLFGEDHAYTVTYRGNGEVIIDMRVALNNSSTDPLTRVTLTLPEGTPTEAAAFQIIKKRRCVQYEGTTQPYYYGDTTVVDESKLPPCLVYEEPNYYDYWWPNTSYFPAQVTIDEKTITITLPKPIAPQNDGSYVLYFRVPQATKSVFGGAKRYRFETLKVTSPIRTLNVGITSDTEMKFKGADTQVYYQAPQSEAMIASAKQAGRDSFQSSTFSNYVAQIGQGQIYKTSSDLAPGETFEVAGMFAKSSISLYVSEFVWIGSGIIAMFIVVLLISMFFTRRFVRPSSEGIKPTSPVKLMMIAITASFLSGVGVALYTLLLVSMTGFLSMWMSSMYGQYNMLAMLLMSILSLGVYSMLVFGPALVFGLRKGIWWGAGVLGMTFMWMVMFLLIIGIYMLLTQSFKPGTLEYRDGGIPIEKQMKLDVPSAPPADVFEMSK